ncbi:MAG TPA: hypothetical protein VM238_09960 [Phycisphaerae bacterium]|nr:hypothetical protein [Thermoguttaceae bacterium]HUU91523.1 hypothetical protein [Phycisphaerae bacterium]HUX02805.1 hypothetical protein [Phycisphaerae bacterium]
MIVNIELKARGPVPGLNIGPREMNSVIRETWIDVGTYWFVHFRGKHFTKQGAAEYGYAPRRGERMVESRAKGWAGTYTGRKFLEHHHTRPLVLTGETEAGSRGATIRGFATRNASRVEIAIGAPKLNFHINRSRVDPAKEMRTISEREKRILREQFESHFDRRVDAFRSTTVIVI